MPEWFFRKKNPSFIWTILFILLVVYLLFQLFSVLNLNADDSKASHSVPKGKVAFVVIEEKSLFSKKSTFKPLLDGLKVWKYGTNNQNVYFKFDNLLPTNDSKVLVIYDQSYQSFQGHSDIFSVNVFPYEYDFNSQQLVTVYDVNKDGTVYLNFKGKKIGLRPNDTYHSRSFEGFQLSSISIENKGLYNLSQFKVLKDNTKTN